MEEAFTDRPHPFTCPFCEAHELRPFGRNSASSCEYCGGMLSGALLQTLSGITGLPDAVGRHACECGHPEMRRLPDGVYRCPACGSEVVPARSYHGEQ
jgi:ribosomal protein L37AE/L43A